MKITTIIDKMYALFKDYPITELEYGSPFQLLVAVVLSAQTTDIQVNKVTKKLFERVSTPQDMVDLGEDTLRGYIKTVGLHQSKAKNLLLTAQILVTMHQQYVSNNSVHQVSNVSLGQMCLDQHELFMKYGYIIPDRLDELVKLPGVGIKTAKVILYVLYGQRRVAVDTHVHRVMNRLGVVTTNSPEQTSKQLETIIPDTYKDIAHHVIIYFGRYLCKAKRPECWRCPLVKICTYTPKNIPG